MTTDLYVPPELSGRPVFRRWAPEVMLIMKGGIQRFNQMLDGIPGISDRILSERLRELDDAGLVERTVYGGPPVRVHYGLTVAGRNYIAPLEAIAAAEAPVEVAVG